MTRPCLFSKTYRMPFGVFDTFVALIFCGERYECAMHECVYMCKLKPFTVACFSLLMCMVIDAS